MEREDPMDESSTKGSLLPLAEDRRVAFLIQRFLSLVDNVAGVALSREWDKVESSWTRASNLLIDIKRNEATVRGLYRYSLSSKPISIRALEGFLMCSKENPREVTVRIAMITAEFNKDYAELLS